MALVAATASLGDSEQVANGRRLNTENREFVARELEAMGFKSISSQANFIMTDMKRPIAPMIAGLRERKVQVGRFFPSLPNYLRVTIGKKAEIEAFLSAFRQVSA
jgi:histidinol-phosphate aminotransferase